MTTTNERLEATGFDTFRVGDPVNWSAGTDVKAGTVVRKTATRIYVQAVEATLLNGPNSGEPDALQVFPGGFAAHVSGVQRHSFGEPSGPELVFTLRKKSGRAQVQGASSTGSMRSWGLLRHGHRAHYDFNF